MSIATDDGQKGLYNRRPLDVDAVIASITELQGQPHSHVVSAASGLALPQPSKGGQYCCRVRCVILQGNSWLAQGARAGSARVS